MILKLAFKIYELLLRWFRPLQIDYFCKKFEAAPLMCQPASKANPKILRIFVPFRDRWDLTLKCLNSIVHQENFDIEYFVHLIDNCSTVETMESLQTWLKGVSKPSLHFVIHSVQEPFNFSKLCNVALGQFQSPDVPEFFLFLNNDVELTNPLSLPLATNFCASQKNCGAVGITLLFPSGRIQHLFAAPGVKIIAAHPFKGRSANILVRWREMARQVPAVTGAFLLISSENFRRIGGFEQRLARSGQDIDLCLKLQKLGLKNWVIPQVEATHHESASRRGAQLDFGEVDFMNLKWGAFLTKNPDYPSEISRWSEQPALSLGEGSYPYKKTTY